MEPAMKSDVVVDLDDGTYQLASTLRFGPGDSGIHGFQMVYQASPGAHPVLSGGRDITGWQRVPGKPGLWQAALPTGLDTRQLFVDGQNLPVAEGLPSGATFVQDASGFLSTSSDIDSWLHPSNVAVAFTGGNGPWTQTFCNIASIQGLQINMAEPCWSNLHLKAEGIQELAWLDDPMGGFGGLSPLTRPTTFLNALALMSPGHWSIDRVAHRIYYMPAAGQDPTRQSIVAPALQSLVTAAGTLTNPVHDLVLSGIQFAYGGWTDPDTNDGFAQMQADWHLVGPGASGSEGTCQYSTPAGTCPFASWTRTPANVVLTATHHVTIAGDTFTHLGGAGLDVYYGSQNDLIQGNEFSDISASAIQLGSTDDPEPADVDAGPSEINSGDVVTDNYIHNVANQYLGGVGIFIGYASGAQITHNQIDDVPYTAISMGWGGWHVNVVGSGSDADPNINAGNVISDNLLYHYMTTLGDGGAIYTNGSQATSWPTALRVTGNIAYDGANTDFSIYTDAASQYVDVLHNFVYDEPFDSFDSGGCHTVGHIDIADNYFSPGGPAYPCGPYTDVQTSNNATVCQNPTPVQAPQDIMAGAGLEPAYRHLIVQGGPSVTMVGPPQLALAGGTVLISGSGFTPDAQVRFGNRAATSVKVLSGNYILAGSPPGSGSADVTVTTPQGTSARGSQDQVSYQALPSGCVPYLGTGISTALVTG